MIFPDNLPYMQTLVKKVYLPKGNPTGRGNLIFPFARNLDETIKIITNTDNFISDMSYKYYYYNLKYSGRLYTKKYYVSDYKERARVYNEIKEKTNLLTFPLQPITNKTNKNMYYEMSKHMEIYYAITNKLSPRVRMNLFWSYLKSIVFTDSLSGFSKKYMIINAENYAKAFEGKLKEKLSNPLFILYYTMFIDFTICKDFDMDILIYNKNKVLKVNPSKLDKKSAMVYKVQLKKLLAGAAPSIDESLNDDNIKKEELAEEVSINLSKTYNFAGDNASKEEVVTAKTLSASKETKEDDAKKSDNISKKIEDKVKEVQEEDKKKDATSADKKEPEKDSNTAGDKSDEGNKSSNTQTKEPEQANAQDELAKKVEDKIDEDKELLEEIYKKTIADAAPVSRASSARDKKIREKQETLEVKGSTISSIKKIQSSHIPIPSNDVSKVVSTTNESMKQVKFNNFAKVYNEKVMTKDIVNAFLSLNDKSIPMTVIKIDVKDTSNELNYKETYTVLLEDVNRQRHTITVDIPKFIDNRFMWLGGSKKIILNQEFLLPVIKSGPDEVQIITNRNKMFIYRVGTKSISSIERINKLVASEESCLKYFTPGYVFLVNSDYITTVEYDEFSKKFESFHCGGVDIYFSQKEVEEIARDKGINIGEDEILIGFKNNKPIMLDTETQKTSDDKTISDLIIESLNDDLKAKYESIKSPKRLMYAGATTMSQNIPIAMLLGFWSGLNAILSKLKAKYRLEKTIPSKLASNESYLKFKDAILVYEEDVPKSLILNGFKLFDTQDYNIGDFEGKEPYIKFFIKVYGKANITGPLMNTYEFTIDPITKEILTDMHLPTEMVDLCLYATSLLADSQYKNDYDQHLARVRNNETVAAILYDQIASQYVVFKNSNGRKKLSLPRDCVIKTLLGLKTVEDVSTLNPMLELERTHTVMYKGWRGINLDDAYTQDKRVYDKSMIGIIGLTSSPDGNVGVQRTLTMEPNITSARGYTKVEDDTSKLNDVNLFSPAELLCPLGPTRDDPTRTGHGVKQSRQVIPVKHSSPVLLSNGAEEICRFSLSSDFVINADQDGKVVEVNDKLGLIVCQYKDGKCQAIDLNAKPVKNGGGGFYLANRLITNLKEGDTFKQGELLAWHKDFFKNDKYIDGKFNMGTLAKVAILSSYNTYEDSTFITEKLSDEMATEMCFNRQVVIGKNANVEFIVKEGDILDIGDSLVQFDTSYEDNELNILLNSISDELKEGVLEGSRNDIRTKVAGRVEKIKIYSTVDLDELSPSLQKVVGSYYKKINAKKKMLEKYDQTSTTVKCGLLFDEPAGKVQPNKFGVIKGQNVQDSVLIEFYIKHEEVLEIGSKVAYFTGLKTTVGEIIESGYEPYSEFRKDEEVSSVIAPNSILARMTPSILLTVFGNKCIIELKRSLYDIYKDNKTSSDLKKKMTDLIYKFFDAFDKSGKNTNKYKELFEPMTDIGFKKWFDGFFMDEDAYLVLDIKDYENTIHMDDIKKAAKVINIPLMEKVALPHITMDKDNIIVTKEPVPVGYIHIKRTQQTVLKKNGVSTGIDIRSSLTGQVTGADKNGRQSDLENAVLVSLGMTNTLREFNGPRSDDMVMKREMLNEINQQGYVTINSLTNDVTNKTTLNTVNTYLLGMGIKSDLVTKGLMIKQTLKEDI